MGGDGPRYNWLDGKASVSSEMLRSIKWMATGVEAAKCTNGEWEDAITQRIAAWRVIEHDHGGVLCLALDQRTIAGLPPG